MSEYIFKSIFFVVFMYMDYKQKYTKYKLKYLAAKKMSGGLLTNCEKDERNDYVLCDNKVCESSKGTDAPYGQYIKNICRPKNSKQNYVCREDQADRASLKPQYICEPNKDAKLNVTRFLEKHEPMTGTYSEAHKQLEDAKKEGNWMSYIFPRCILPRDHERLSAIDKYYSIKSKEEIIKYLETEELTNKYAKSLDQAYKGLDKVVRSSPKAKSFLKILFVDTEERNDSDKFLQSIALFQVAIDNYTKLKGVTEMPKWAMALGENIGQIIQADGPLKKKEQQRFSTLKEQIKKYFNL